MCIRDSANISIRKEDNNYIGFDICVANQALNFLAVKLGKEYDDAGKIAASGKLLEDEIVSLNSNEYYEMAAPKSLSNERAMSMVQAFVENEN